jgi:hypothetical protein
LPGGVIVSVMKLMMAAHSCGFKITAYSYRMPS